MNTQLDLDLGDNEERGKKNNRIFMVEKLCPSSRLQNITMQKKSRKSYLSLKTYGY